MPTGQRDCPGLFRHRAPWSRLICGLAVCVLGLLMPNGNGGVSLSAPPAAPAAPASGQTLYVDWTITATGDRADQYSTYHRRISIVGSSVVRQQQPNGRTTAVPFQLTLTDDEQIIGRGACTERTENRYITNPTRWMGGPDPLWSGTTWITYQEPDNTWYMTDPFYNSFFVNGDVVRDFAYRTDQHVRDLCGGEDRFYTYTNDMAYYQDIFPLAQSQPLVGDSLGTTFTRDDTYSVDTQNYVLTVNFHARVHLACSAGAASEVTAPGVQAPSQAACGCDGPPGPVADNPATVCHHMVRVDYGGAAIQPTADAQAELTIAVTCNGHPVTGAQLDVTVVPQANSGGHQHNANRPRGYLRGPGGGAFVELTDAHPSIRVTTDAAGTAVVAFQPPRANCNCEGVPGISGIYQVQARSVRTGTAANRDITVRIDGLEEAAAGDWYTLVRGGRETHPEGFQGTRATLDKIADMAALYHAEQITHNLTVSPTWPILPLSVNDISLPDGGLFDLHNNWRPSHQTHGEGHGFDVNRNFVQAGEPNKDNERWNWRRDAMMTAGRAYGYWDATDLAQTPANGGPLYHLHVNQGAAAPGRARSVSAGPDIAVLGLVSGPWLRPAAAPGQVVTYAVGVDNLFGGADAPDTVLTVTLPLGLTPLGTSPPPTRTLGSNQFAWDLGTFPAGKVPQMIWVSATILPTVTVGSVLTLTAAATTSAAETVLGNNLDDEFGFVFVSAPGADLSVSSGLAGVATTVGELVTFTMQVGNFGNLPATATALTLTLPTSVTLNGANPLTSTGAAGSYVWNLGTFAPGDSKAITVGVTLDPRLMALVPFNSEMATTPLTYTILAGSATPDVDLADNVLEVAKPVELPGPDLAIGLGLSGMQQPGALTAGEEVTYTITYGNFGNRVAPTTTVTVSLWSGIQLLGAQPPPAQAMTSMVFAGGVVGWNLGTLAVGDEGVIRLRVRVNSLPANGGFVLAVITTGVRDIVPENNVALDMLSEAVLSALYLPSIRR